MLSRSERYAFVGEAKLSTFRNFFRPPSLADLLEGLEEKLAERPVPSQHFGTKVVTLTHMAKIDGKVAALFRLANPDIPDNVLEHVENRTLREAKRGADEIPAISAHVVFDTSNEFDIRHAYPVMIENVDSFPRSTIELYLLRLLGDLFGEERPYGPRGEMRSYRPRISFVGHPSKTIRNVLNRGGALAGVHFERSVVTDDGFGEEAYTVSRTEDIYLRVSGKPRGERALEWLQRQTRTHGNGADVRIRVAIEDESGRVKTAKIDPTRDVIENFFVLQEQFDEFDNPLLPCAEEIRVDLVRKMIGKLPR